MNVFAALPVPSGDGLGVWVDVSTMTGEKTISVDGGDFVGTLYIEASNDAAAHAAPAAVLPFTSNQLAVEIAAIYQFMRVRRTGTTGNSAPGTPTVKVAAQQTTANIFGVLAVPPNNGVGAPIDLSAGGNLQTFTVVGLFSGQLIIEISTDLGVSFSPALTFDSGQQVTQTFAGVVSSARVRRRNSEGAAPAVAVGSGNAVAGGASSGSSSPGNFSNTILTRAITLVGFTQPTYWDDPFLQVPGRPGSLWGDIHGVDMHPVKEAPGGVLHLFSNAGYGGAVIDPSGAYPFIVADQPSWFGQVATIPKLYMYFRFQMNDPVGGWNSVSDTLVMGFVDGETLRVCGMGMAIGHNSFGAVGGNVTNAFSTVGLDSAVPIDFNVWHYGELYTAAGKWWFKIDDGTPLDVSALFGGVGLNYSQPLIQIMTTGVSIPSVWIDHAAYICEGNGPILSAVPA